MRWWLRSCGGAVAATWMKMETVEVVKVMELHGLAGGLSSVCVGFVSRGSQVPLNHQTIKHALPFFFCNFSSKINRKLLVLISTNEKGTTAFAWQCLTRSRQTFGLCISSESSRDVSSAARPRSPS